MRPQAPRIRETEYQVGRRVEQVIGQPGSIQRLQVVAVIKDALDPTQLAQVKALIGATVGAVAERGDTVVIHAMGPFTASPPAEPAVAMPAESGGAQTTAVLGSATAAGRAGPSFVLGFPGSLTIFAIALAAALTLVAWRFESARRRNATGRALTEMERAASLDKVRHWMRDGGEPPANPGGRP